MGEFNEGIVIIVRAGVVWRGAGTLAVALGGGLSYDNYSTNDTGAAHPFARSTARSHSW